ncbi:MAG: tRNA lysidine(34) synthetase TilS [Treponema sp.]|nr:tRNA lysidine(34) synthetase TilS [Treponema sp.]
MLQGLFENKVRDSLVALGVSFEELRKNKSSFGLGISGGADSVSLFLVLCDILKIEKIPLVCVTVNHHVREKNETDGDMNFVIDLCKDAVEKGFDVSLEVFDLTENQVSIAEKERGCGTEEACRFVRYNCFEAAIEKNNISYFCLAHNLNDNLETILMRFLKGSGAGGIEAVRGKYIRPLINISRSEIETFLKDRKQDFRTDSTNLSDDYLRNKIRHNIIPVLEENIPGWKEAVLTGEEKRRTDSMFLENLAVETEFSSELFEKGNEAVCSRVLLREMNLAGVTERIPSAFLNDMIFEIRKALKSGKSFSKRFGSCECGVHKGEVFVKTLEKTQTDSGFFDIIEEDGIYDFPFGKVSVHKAGKSIQIETEGKTVTIESDFPFVIRSPVLGEKKQLFVIES